MSLRYLALVAAFCPVSVLAQDWALRAQDRLLTREEVAALTEGRTLVFYDDGRSKFSAGGAYSYTYASGASAFGRYRVEADGTVCIDYRNGFGRCDRYVQSGDRIVMLTERGERFPIRPLAD
ncbi:hypothetical protein [uncultured Roseobacter sp.]|uniref:hypothetical protein n=1 Tax=uncultured Roseobacter sp. TaxID=114847 RepID=UPI0026270C29|nr:hypothetical protein [uncultured Roseobacter sp.]